MNAARTGTGAGPGLCTPLSTSLIGWRRFTAFADRITILQDGRTFTTLMPIFWTSAGAKPAPTLYGVDADVFASVVRVQQAIASVTRLPPRHWQGA